MSELTQERVKFLFDYKDGFLIRAVDKHTAKKGDVIKGCLTGKGYKTGKGYLSARVDNKLIQLHRVIFLWHHGYLPKYIDHINNDQTDNKIENLRECTASENMANKPMTSSNSTGFKGVYFRKDVEKYGAEVTFNGVTHYFGLYKTAQEASAVVEANRIKIHKEFTHAAI
jgi:hypothetical protein